MTYTIKEMEAAKWHSKGVDGVRKAKEFGMPLHAYIPMMDYGYGRGQMPIEFPPVAYTNQMQAKRVCDAWRKRWKRRHPDSPRGTTIMGVNLA